MHTHVHAWIFEVVLSGKVKSRGRYTTQYHWRQVQKSYARKKTKHFAKVQIKRYIYTEHINVAADRGMGF